ncbi:MAG: hypothetical protein IJI83_00635 [Oscillospiraceae bacterium]|nr:hypothetical protein [Oscillospiraceae bacterium]
MNKRRTDDIHIRVTEKEKQQILQKAEKAKMSVSQYVMSCMRGEEYYPAPTEELRRIFIGMRRLEKRVLDMGDRSLLEEVREVKELVLATYYAAMEQGKDTVKEMEETGLDYKYVR